MRWFLLALALTVGAVQSRESGSEEPKQKRAEPKKRAQADQRGTEQFPFVVKTPEKTEVETKREEAERYEKTRNERWLTYSTVWLGAVTTALALFTYWLWGATKELVKESRRALISTERAFVFISAFEVHRLKEKRQLMIIPKWENSGSTPTKDMLTCVNWHFFETDIPENYDFSDITPISDEGTRVLIGPKATMHASSLLVPDEVAERVVKGNGKIYIWGWADYNDVFENTPRHRTEFCNEVVIMAINDKDLGIRFMYYRKHNGADGECMKRPRMYPS